MFRELPFVAFEVGPNGTMDDFSSAARDWIGQAHAVRGAKLEAIFAESSCANIKMRLATLPVARTATGERVELALSDDAQTTLHILLVTLPSRDGQPARLFACEDVDSGMLISTLLEHAEVLHGFIETVSEPMWGIGFDEPIDLTEDEDGIVHQVFSNECHWIFYNRALRALYCISETLDMHALPVAAQFPRSPQNETFVRQLIRRKFRADNLTSVDIRADGTTVYVENNVCGHIQDQRLYRMWGTVRDITGQRSAQELVSQQLEFVRSVLTALPVAVAVIDRSTCMHYVNRATANLLGEAADTLIHGFLSRYIRDIDIHIWPRWCNGEFHQDHIELHMPSGALLRCALAITPLDDESGNLFVVTIDPLIPRNFEPNLQASLT
jgi:PAS domain-containing protein